jgi:hypothetical protein
MTNGRPLRICALAIAALLVPATVALAQNAAAETLFREGRKLLKSGDVAGACAKFEASKKIEPSVGTLLNLGECREKLGQTAGAWASFRAAEAMARRQRKDDKRADEAKRRAAKLEPKLAYLEIEVDAGTRVDGLAITRGGETVDRGAWNTEVPVDPGSYEIVATAPGYRAWTVDVVIEPDDRHRVVVVPPLAAAPVVDDEERDDERASAGVAMRVERKRPVTATRKLAIGVGTIGLAAIGGGVVYGLRARDLQAEADAVCPETRCGDDEALRQNEEAQRSALRANLMYAGGGVALAAAVVMWWLGAPDEGGVVVRPSGGQGEVGVSVQGSF